MSSNSYPQERGSSSSITTMPSGPPYYPRTAMIGGHPTSSVDDPISAVILVFYIVAAVLNMFIYVINIRRSQNFQISFMLVGFCAARIAANVFRMAWASYPDIVQLIIAAQVFVNAGVVMIFVINFILVQRIFQAYNPNIDRRKTARAFYALLAGIMADIIMVIVALVCSFYTLNLSELSKIRYVQRVGATYLALMAFLPLPIIAFCTLLPRKYPMENFGRGTMRTKIYLLIFASILLSVGAGFRAGVALEDVHLATDPAWFHHKAAFYCFNYGIEIIVVYAYTLCRIDRLFYIPGKNSGSDHDLTCVETAGCEQSGNDTSTEVVLEDKEAGNEESAK